MDATHLVAAGILAFVGWHVWAGFTQPPPSLDGKEVIHNEPTVLHGDASPGDADAVLGVHDRSHKLLAEGYLDHWGVIHQTSEQREHGEVVLSLEPQSYLSRWWYSDVGPPYIDAGAYLSVAKGGEDRFAPGVRLSPARYFYNSVSPDLILTERAIGVGISFYPPARSVGSGWSHVGLEISYLHPLRDGGPRGFAIGLATSPF